MLDVKYVDAFPPVDLHHARQLGLAQPTELVDGLFHRLTMTHRHFMSSSGWFVAAMSPSRRSGTPNPFWVQYVSSGT